MSYHNSKELKAPQGRDVSIDVIRGIAIILVIYAHSWPFCKNFLRLFNLPIFMVVSGYCFKNRIRSWADWRHYMARKVRTLYVPCAVYNGVFVLLGGLFLRLGIYTDDPAFLKVTQDWPVPQQLYTLHSASDVLRKFLRVILLTDTTQPGTGTWFLITLFAICAFHGAFCVLTAKQSKTAKQITLAGLFLLTALLAQFVTLSMTYTTCTFYCYLAYITGIVLRDLDLKVLERPLFACLSFLVLVNMARFIYLDIATAQVPGVPLYLLGILCGWWMLKPAADLIARQEHLCRVLSYVGRNTVPIVCLHILCFKLVTLLYISTRHLPGYYLASFHVDFDVPESWKLLYLAVGTLLPLLLAAAAKEMVQSWKSHTR